MTIYGPDRNKRHVFYDGKRVARSPLSNKTSTFDPTSPRNRRFAREGRTFFLNVRPSRTKHHFLARSGSNTAKLAFYTRGRKVFCTTFQNTQYYRRECIKRGPKGVRLIIAKQRPDLFWTLKNQYYTGNYRGKLIFGRLQKKKSRAWTHKNDKLCNSDP